MAGQDARCLLFMQRMCCGKHAIMQRADRSFQSLIVYNQDNVLFTKGQYKVEYLGVTTAELSILDLL